MPYVEGARKVRAFSDGHFVRRVSRDSDSGRHDAGEPFDAEAENMLRVPSGIGGTAGARPLGERPVRGLSRRAQQRAEDVAAGGSAFVAEQEAVVPFPVVSSYLAI